MDWTAAEYRVIQSALCCALDIAEELAGQPGKRPDENVDRMIAQLRLYWLDLGEAAKEADGNR